MKRLLVGILLFASVIGAYFWNPFGPNTFEECILKNMKGTTSDMAAKEIAMACDDKFNPTPIVKKCETREMTFEEVQKVVGNGSIEYRGEPYFSGRFYNGNSLVTIEELTVLVWGANISSPQQYNLSMSYPIQPNTSGAASNSVQNMPGKNFGWDIVSIKTCTK
jgi:hypothetical protein